MLTFVIQIENFNICQKFVIGSNKYGIKWLSSFLFSWSFKFKDKDLWSAPLDPITIFVWWNDKNCFNWTFIFSYFLSGIFASVKNYGIQEECTYFFFFLISPVSYKDLIFQAVNELHFLSLDDFTSSSFFFDGLTQGCLIPLPLKSASS